MQKSKSSTPEASLTKNYRTYCFSLIINKIKQQISEFLISQFLFNKTPIKIKTDIKFSVLEPKITLSVTFVCLGKFQIKLVNFITRFY